MRRVMLATLPLTLLSSTAADTRRLPGSDALAGTLAAVRGEAVR